MAEPATRDRRAFWTFAGIGLNTVLSLTAIGLWAFSPRPVAPSPLASAASAVQPLAPVTVPVRPARGVPVAPRPLWTGAPEDGPVVRPAAAGKRTERASASVVALCERLHLNPTVVAEQLGDANGDIPKSSADRLERGFRTGEALAKRLGLDEGPAQSMVTLVTDHVVRVLREEKSAWPKEVAPSRIEEITSSTVDDIRATCGEGAAEEARRELSRL